MYAPLSGKRRRAFSVAPFTRAHIAPPRSVLTTEDLGRAMLEVAKHGASKPILEARDITALKPAPSPPR